LLRAHQLRIDASSLEELQHEARDALIQHYGPAHVGYRARVRRRRQADAEWRGASLSRQPQARRWIVTGWELVPVAVADVAA